MPRILAVVLCLSLIAASQGNTFDRVRYNGGTISNPVDPKDWNNHLTVTSDAIAFKFKNGQEVSIDPKSVRTLSYGQEAHRRVGTMIALAILVAPVALFGLLHKTRLHFIGMEWTSDGKKQGMLLQGDKDNYRAILVALQSVSGVAVSVAEKEREFIPVGVTTSVAKGTTQESGETAPTMATADSGITTVDVSSSPDAVDVYVDGQFVGNSPATLKLKSGKHIVSAKMNGYADWERELTVSGGTVNLNAKLVSGPSSPLTASASKAPFDADTKGMGWIGINTNDDGAGNVVIARIAPNSSAARAGLQIGDIIKQLNGVPVGSGERFYVAIARCHPGTEILLSYTRGASRSETKLLVEKEF
jgi:hypothetical protein